jgi:branched-chain amino acid aminotransferase
MLHGLLRLLAVIGFLIGQGTAGEKYVIKKDPFGVTPDGRAVDLYTLSNASGTEVRVTNYGGIIVSLIVPDRNGRLADIVLGYDDLKGYYNNKAYFGALIGRYGNRIADGKFESPLLQTAGLGPGDLGIDPRKCPRTELIVIARQLTMYAAAAAGIKVVTSTFRRNAPDATSPSIKSLNYLNNILARIEANDRGADEALMLDGQGYVSEATVDNFFIVTEDALLTPPTATNLKGITRETLLEVAASLGIKAEARPFTLFDVWTSKEAFICGTGAEVVPVLSVDGRTIGTGGIGPITTRIVAGYHDVVRSQGTPIQPVTATELLASAQG